MTALPLRAVFTLALTVVLITPAAGVATASQSNPNTPTLEAHTTFSLTPETPGEVTATTTYSVPADISSFSIDVSDPRITVTDSTAFTKSGSSYEWDAVNDGASITYTIDVPSDRPVSSNTYGVDTGDWAMIYHVGFPTQWRYYGSPPEYKRTASVDGDGVAGNGYVFLGPHTSFTESVDDRDVTVVVPEGSELGVDRDELFDSFHYTAAHIGTADTWGRSTVIAIPSTEYASTPGRASQSDFYVYNNKPLDTPSNTWVHEYVHSVQDFNQASDMDWYIEASADYYSGVVPLNMGGTSYDRFETIMDTTGYHDAVLTEPDTWSSSSVQYQKGRHVVAALDAQIQSETDGQKTFTDVYNRTVEHDGELTYFDFRRILVDVAGPETGDWADAYIASTGLPDFPTEKRTFLLGDGDTDTDDDGLSNALEEELQTDPLDPDTDGDGITDSDELELGTKPVSIDTDFDTLPDHLEQTLGLNPTEWNEPQSAYDTFAAGFY